MDIKEITRKKWTPAERAELLKKQDEELETFMMNESKKQKSSSKFNEEEFENMLETHPIFMKKDTIITQDDIDKNPILKGLQQVKYDENDTPQEKALAHKKDGNFWFQKKMYSKARLAYTEALKMDSKDIQLEAILYTNRAAANFYLKNYRSSYIDAYAATKLDPQRLKALIRCAQCSKMLKRYDQTIDWCKIIISIEADNEFAIKCIADACTAKKVAERDLRKKKKEQCKVKNENKKLMDEVLKRGVTLDSKVLEKNDDSDEEEELSEVQLFMKQISSPTGKIVALKENLLYWPVLLMYPEYKTSDFIEGFGENTHFSDHVEALFSHKAPWDEHYEYRVGNLDVFVENYKEEKLYEVPLNISLRKILSSPKVVVRTGTPGFVILAKSSSFRSKFVKKYTQIYKLPL